jgi:hypothetical protein
MLRYKSAFRRWLLALEFHHRLLGTDWFSDGLV